ncbi:MAG: zinc-ribbon domain-containing protein, partial [Veillonellaceae bacterium]|nr:zinc-ribbon domain-containing protein [Veillonellaceae bacterium]
MANFCDNCGAKLDANSKFCPSCGTAINNGEAVLTTANTLPTENSNLPVGKTISESGLVLHSSAPISRTCSWVRWLYILFAILVCAGGLGVIGLMLTFAFDCYAKDFHRGKMRRM